MDGFGLLGLSTLGLLLTSLVGGMSSVVRLGVGLRLLRLKGSGSVIIFLLCASLRATSTARSRVVAPLSAALACTNWRHLGVRNRACRLIGGALPALGSELFTGHGHVVLLCLVLVLWFCCPCTN